MTEELTARKIGMVNAIYANGYIEKKEDAVRGVEEHFDEAIAFLYDPKPKAEEIDKENPFFAAIDKGLPDIDVKLPEGAKSGGLADFEVEIDQ